MRRGGTHGPTVMGKSAGEGFAAASNAVATGAAPILAVGLPEMRRAEAEKISQRARKAFVLQIEEVLQRNSQM